jgi:hypothetical protein
MPATTYQAMKLVKALGLNYEPILACTNACVFFRGALKQSHVYPKCDVNRYVDGSIGIPQKMRKHFLLIMWLLCMRRCKNLENLLIWHKNETSVNGIVHSMPNSKSWKHITNRSTKLVNDAYEIMLRLAQVMG